jgi:hypothetical protein
MKELACEASFLWALAFNQAVASAACSSTQIPKDSPITRGNRVKGLREP